MNKEELTRKIMRGLRESLNESKAFDLKTNKDHKAAYNSFVKWYNRWKEKLGREEIRALVKKVANDALGDNLDMINESKQLYEWGKPGAADEALAEDLALTFSNTYELQEKYADWMANALLKRLRKGQPVLEEHLANCSTMNVIVSATIEKYREDFPQTYVSTATRKLLKQKIAHEIFAYATNEWENEQDNE